MTLFSFALIGLVGPTLSVTSGQSSAATHAAALDENRGAANFTFFEETGTIHETIVLGRDLPENWKNIDGKDKPRKKKVGKSDAGAAFDKDSQTYKYHYDDSKAEILKCLTKDDFCFWPFPENRIDLPLSQTSCVSGIDGPCCFAKYAGGGKIVHGFMAGCSTPGWKWKWTTATAQESIVRVGSSIDKGQILFQLERSDDEQLRGGVLFFTTGNPCSTKTEQIGGNTERARAGTSKDVAKETPLAKCRMCLPQHGTVELEVDKEVKSCDNVRRMLFQGDWSIRSKGEVLAVFRTPRKNTLPGIACVPPQVATTLKQDKPGQDEKATYCSMCLELQGDVRFEAPVALPDCRTCDGEGEQAFLEEEGWTANTKTPLPCFLVQKRLIDGKTWQLKYDRDKTRDEIILPGPKMLELRTKRRMVVRSVPTLLRRLLKKLGAALKHN